MRTRSWNLVVLLLALCLALASCSSNNDSDSATSNEPAPSEPTAVAPADTPELGTVVETPPSEPDLPIEVEVTVDTEAGIDVGIDLSPEGIFAGATAALEALDSYRFTTSFLFTGEEDGEVESGSIELSGEIMDAQRKHFVWRNVADDEHIELIQLGDQAWIHDEEDWESVPVLVAEAMSQTVLVFAPSVAWAGLFGSLETQATYIGPETIDGVQAHHYTSTYQQLAGYWQGELVDATGDVWIADAGYPLRYSFTATGQDENGDRGSISWTMELTDVNETIVIEPPI